MHSFLTLIPSEIKEIILYYADSNNLFLASKSYMILSNNPIIVAKLLITRHRIWNSFTGKIKQVDMNQWRKVVQERAFTEQVAKVYMTHKLHDTIFMDLMYEYCVSKPNFELQSWIIENVQLDSAKQLIFMNRAMVQCSIAGYTDFVHLYLKNGADVRFDNNASISMSSKHGHLDIVKELIKNGCDIHVDDSYPICWASKNGHFEVVKCLVEAGANISARNGCSLHWASEGEYPQIVNYLLDSGLSIHSANDYALRWSSVRGLYRMVSLLLSRGANVHASNDYALRNAVKLRHIDIVELLLKYGADIHAENDEVLKWCDSHTDQEMKSILLQPRQRTLVSSL